MTTGTPGATQSPKPRTAKPIDSRLAMEVLNFTGTPQGWGFSACVIHDQGVILLCNVDRKHKFLIDSYDAFTRVKQDIAAKHLADVHAWDTVVYHGMPLTLNDTGVATAAVYDDIGNSRPNV